jgi:glucokinase
MTMLSNTKLVGDIGGTNARFALVDAQQNPHSIKVYPTEQYASLSAALAHYLRDLSIEPPKVAAFAVATRVLGDDISFTNNERWSFSIEEFAAKTGVGKVQVVNDFTALALSVPYLSSEQKKQIGDGISKPREPFAVIGPGTGLGVSGLIPANEKQWLALNSEGGHCSASAGTEREIAVLCTFAKWFGHVSYERFLSGPGLVNLVRALREIDGVASNDIHPASVTQAALSGRDPLCVEALELFCAILGSYAGDLALTLGASGGVFVGGGIVPKLGDFFYSSQFRSRFESKGRVSDELLDVPTFVITDPYPGLRGAARMLEYA